MTSIHPTRPSAFGYLQTLGTTVTGRAALSTPRPTISRRLLRRLGRLLALALVTGSTPAPSRDALDHLDHVARSPRH